MSDYIEWGGKSQELERLRRQQEIDALYEQAARVRAARQAQKGVGGGSILSTTPPAIPSLQQVLDFNHDLVDGNNI